jgi:hypothetical protein
VREDDTAQCRRRISADLVGRTYAEGQEDQPGGTGSRHGLSTAGAFALDGTQVEAAKSYRVVGWASVNLDQNGTPVWEVVAKHLRAARTAKVEKLNQVKLKGVGANPGYEPRA